MAMTARVKWVESLRFLGSSGSGHGVLMDASDTAEGEVRLGASPMETVLIGLGGCTTYDIVHILGKMRLAFEDVSVELSAERAPQTPRVFTTIHALFTVVGDVPLDKAEEAARLSIEKYCSASQMLGKTAKITHQVLVIPCKIGDDG